MNPPDQQQVKRPSGPTLVAVLLGAVGLGAGAQGLDAESLAPLLERVGLGGAVVLLLGIGGRQFLVAFREFSKGLLAEVRGIRGELREVRCELTTVVVKMESHDDRLESIDRRLDSLQEVKNKEPR